MDQATAARMASNTVTRARQRLEQNRAVATVAATISGGASSDTGADEVNGDPREALLLC